jgi:hypothetical protein
MKKIRNENNLIEIINDKKIKTWIKIKYILDFNDKINMSDISKLLNITRKAVHKSIILHNLNYDKKKRKRNVVLFKEKNKRDYKTYIIKDESNYLYKIGKSINPQLREKTLQSEKPTIKIIKIFDKNIEKELHKQYKEFRVRGEWFNLNSIQVNYICTKY